MDSPPIPLRRRHDGWTPERQAAFLAALVATGAVAKAAARVGMSRVSAYKLRQRPEAAAFRAAWDAALAEAWARVEASALERALQGETEVWDDDGVVITRRRPCAPRLLIRMLDRAAAQRAKDGRARS